MTIKDIIQQLRITMDDAREQESHFESWLTQNEGICKAIDSLKTFDNPPKAQPEQVDCPRCGHVCSQRPWVGLTDDEILEAAQIDASDTWLFETAYAIEAKLKERNT